MTCRRMRRHGNTSAICIRLVGSWQPQEMRFQAAPDQPQSICYKGWQEPVTGRWLMPATRWPPEINHRSPLAPVDIHCGPLPPVILLQRPAHQLRLVAIRQAVGVSEGFEALLVGQQFRRSCPVRAPHAAVDAKGFNNLENRGPDVVVGVGLMGQGASGADLDPDIGLAGQSQHLRQVSP
jgi:hypothetical protein